MNIQTQEINQSQTRTLNIGGNGNASVNNRKETFWSLENYLTYNKQFGQDHSVYGLLGISWQETNVFCIGASLTASLRTTSVSITWVPVLPTPVLVPVPSRFAFNSYFGRINYGFRNRYLFTATGRADGSSKFGENNKFAFFPSAALAWRVSEEDFLKGNSIISNLKIRSSYGLTGNSEIPPYSSLSLLSSNYATIYNDTRVSGTGINRLANPDLRWEKTAQTDVGLEIGLVQGPRITRSRLLLPPDYRHAA